MRKFHVIYLTFRGGFSPTFLVVKNAVLWLKTKIKYLKIPRTGDHQWYITDMTKFHKRYPKWKISFTVEDIIEELIDNNSRI